MELDEDTLLELLGGTVDLLVKDPDPDNQELVRYAMEEADRSFKELIDCIRKSGEKPRFCYRKRQTKAYCDGCEELLLKGGFELRFGEWKGDFYSTLCEKCQARKPMVKFLEEFGVPHGMFRRHD